jgi:hypothetical protein
MAKKSPLRDRKAELIASAGVARVRLERTEPDKLVCYQRISWEIDKATSGGNTRCRLVIEGRGYDLPIAEQSVPTAGVLYWYEESVWLVPGEKICLIVDQAQASTNADLHGIGYWRERDEGVV